MEISNRTFDSLVRLLSVAAISALLLSLAAAGTGHLPLDVVVTRQLQSVDIPGLNVTVDLLNWAGDTVPAVTIALMIVLILMRFGKSAEALLVGASILARGFNPLLKEICNSPRPDSDLVQVTSLSSGFGFPSGHSMGAMLLYGSVFIVAWRLRTFAGRNLVLFAAAFLVIGTGFSRIYVGAHWPSDVLGGFLWGVTFLTGILILERIYQRRNAAVRWDQREQPERFQ